MTSSRPSISLILALVTLALAGACSGGSGCGGCGSTTPLPAGGLPADQTVEGGGQIRVTPAGMDKIQTLARTMVEAQLGEGFCIPPTELGDADGTLGTGAFLCQGSQNQCTPGCDTDVSIDSITVAAAGTQTLRLRAQVDAVASVPTSFQVLGIGGSCTVTVRANNVVLIADIALGINGTSGELSIGNPQVPRPNLTVNFSNCGLASSLLNLFSSFFTTYIADAVVNVVRPTLEQLIRDLLPNPLGIAGAIDLNSLIGGLTSNPTSGLEARLLPGGYVHFTPANGGLSLGLITGFNADRNPATRTPELDGEVARCVPALPPPNFATAPHSLPRTPVRNTFALPAAAAFDGGPDPAGADLAIGLSETTLDLLGHHLVTSGAACLGLGTSLVAQLNLGTFALVSPSLAELGSEKRNDPMLLVTRPTQAVDFVIGEGTAASPRLTMKIKDFDIDVYAFVYERYTRAFTMTASIDVGLNLELEQAPGMPVTIKPVLVGVSSKNLKLDVANTELLKEKKADLLAVLPVIIDLATGALGDLPSITVPAFAGFSLENLAVSKVVTGQDAFLAVTGNLGAQANPALAALMSKASGAAQANGAMLLAPAVSPRRAGGSARLASVSVPPLDEVRAAAQGVAGNAMPAVTFEVDRTDDLGRELEWSWRLDHGLWRPYSSASPLVISDRAFAFQGDYTISLMSRVKGDFRTVSAEQEHQVRIDSVPPHLVKESTQWKDGGLAVAGFDVVAKTSISIAFGRPGQDAPTTAWTEGDAASIDAATVRALAVGGEVVVFLKDPTGNVEQALVSPSSNFHGKADAGCNCDSSGGPSGGALALLGVTGLLLMMRRRARSGLMMRVAKAAPRLRGAGSTLAVWLLLSVAASMMPACDCGGAEGRACELVQDCGGFCTESGQVPFCVEGACVCADDIPPGKIGPYADIAVSNNGVAWVVAYAQTYGDLVAIKARPGRVKSEDWEWVDGVPDGPVVVENAKIRHGIDEAGPDVGMYPSVAVTSKDEPVVSYFDRETASLRFAARVGGVWTNHVVDAGTGTLAGATGALVGLYTSLTVRGDDGRPGIAYLAHVKDASGTHAEVRYASAQVAEPKVAADWQIKIVDQAPLPPVDAAKPNLYPLPEGLGLFIDSARMPNQAPVVVYYDRSNGALKMGVFNPTSGNFVTSLLVGGVGNDAGWSPSVTVDAIGKVHIAYVSAARDDLAYTRVATAPVRAELTEVADDGYREVGQTSGGLPKPELHFVGDDASLVVSLSGVPVITYQDATSHELLIARRQSTGLWSRTSVAGGEETYEGAYGFFAASAATSSTLYIANWVLDPANDQQWVEIFERPLVE
jgi:MYXO-CTERM domain-containing protein